MKHLFQKAILILGVWTILPAPVQADPADTRVVFFSSPRQRELWWCAGGTLAGAQLYQYLGMQRTPAIVYATLQTAGVAVGQIYLKTEPLKAHTLAMEGLGILLGSVANVSIHFDYLGHQLKDNPYVEEIPTTP